MDTTEAPQIIEYTGKSLTYTPFDTKWVPCSSRFVVLGQTPSAKGMLQVMQLDQHVEGKMKQLKEIVKGPG